MLDKLTWAEWKSLLDCIEGFWRLAIKTNWSFHLWKIQFVSQKPARPQAKKLFNGSPGIFTNHIDKAFYLLYIKHTFFSVWYPSGKGLVCKTIIGRFDSYPHLLKELPREVLFFCLFYCLPLKAGNWKKNQNIIIYYSSARQRVLLGLILWRVPAFPQDAEGLGKQCAYFCNGVLISQAPRTESFIDVLFTLWRAGFAYSKSALNFF